jgi:aminoglycoside 6'-N-acetyltransferase
MAPAIVVPAVAANTASWRLFERAGLRRVATGPLRPHHPIDEGAHCIYRIDRPTL